MENDRSYYKECIVEGCTNLIKIKENSRWVRSGKCGVCAYRKPPFVALFNRFLNSAKHEKKEVSLTFGEFLEFTKQTKCHYCHSTLDWKPYYTVNNEYVGGAYYLDRKDNNIGYHKENIVACCTKCNIAKGSRFLYEEWYGMTKYFRDKRKQLLEVQDV